MIGAVLIPPAVEQGVRLAKNLPGYVDDLNWTIVAIAYQQFENYVVQPRIQSRAVKLDPFVVVIAALFGGTLLGIVGALLAIPSAAAIQIALREYWEYRRAYGPGAPAAPG